MRGIATLLLCVLGTPGLGCLTEASEEEVEGARSVSSEPSCTPWQATSRDLHRIANVALFMKTFSEITQHPAATHVPVGPASPDECRAFAEMIMGKVFAAETPSFLEELKKVAPEKGIVLSDRDESQGGEYALVDGTPLYRLPKILIKQPDQSYKTFDAKPFQAASQWCYLAAREVLSRATKKISWLDPLPRSKTCALLGPCQCFDGKDYQGADIYPGETQCGDGQIEVSTSMKPVTCASDGVWERVCGCLNLRTYHRDANPYLPWFVRCNSQKLRSGETAAVTCDAEGYWQPAGNYCFDDHNTALAEVGSMIRRGPGNQHLFLCQADGTLADQGCFCWNGKDSDGKEIVPPDPRARAGAFPVTGVGNTSWSCRSMSDGTCKWCHPNSNDCAS
jgi:hypothetical protein